MNMTGDNDHGSGRRSAAAVMRPRSGDGKVNCKSISDSLLRSGLWRIPGHAQEQERVWRISPEPFQIDPGMAMFLRRLGPALHSFYNAANSLYIRGERPWVNDYLDRGKPQSLVEFGRMNFQRRRLPAVIRPDIILGEDGHHYITELDSVPGGIGLTDALSTAYEESGFELLGGRRGMLQGFCDAMDGAFEPGKQPCVAIVVSEESEEYRSEMEWLADQMRREGWRAFAVRPEEVSFREEGLFLGEQRVDLVYRFFELFDLKNIPKSELVMYAAKKKRVVATPPYKPYLEEKSLLALFHHPMLEADWRRLMGDEAYDFLGACIPRTWILDSRPAPPHTLVPGFRFGGQPVNDWRTIASGSQKERRLVIKPSGFSPTAWGSRGVVVGHDVSQVEWAEAVERALESFPALPYVLQPFHEGKRVRVRYLDEGTSEIVEMDGRVRLSPYYFVSNNMARLGGALATICPMDKKLIHGMVDAVMVPCSEGSANSENR